MNKLKEYRGSRTIEEVTESLNLHPEIYIEYENGEREPLPVVKELIAKYFDVAVTDIWV